MHLNDLRLVQLISELRQIIFTHCPLHSIPLKEHAMSISLIVCPNVFLFPLKIHKSKITICNVIVNGFPYERIPMLSVK
jgi:hypothetical protein